MAGAHNFPIMSELAEAAARYPSGAAAIQYGTAGFRTLCVARLARIQSGANSELHDVESKLMLFAIEWQRIPCCILE